jgi:hypothetical protein
MSRLSACVVALCLVALTAAPVAHLEPGLVFWEPGLHLDGVWDVDLPDYNAGPAAWRRDTLVARFYRRSLDFEDAQGRAWTRLVTGSVENGHLTLMVKLPGLSPLGESKEGWFEGHYRLDGDCLLLCVDDGGAPPNPRRERLVRLTRRR